SVDYTAFLRGLWRRKFLLIFISLAGTAASILLVLCMTPQYVAHALVSIGDPLPKVFSGNANATSPLPDPGAIQTEVDMLKSPQPAARVIDDVGLANSPAFTAPPSFKERLRPIAKLLLGTEITSQVFGSPDKPEPPNAADIRSSVTTNAFLQRLRVA